MTNRALLLTAGLSALGGCYAEVPDEVTKGVVVLTRRDAAADFKAYATFAINPDVPLFEGSGAPSLLPPGLATQFIDRVRQNLLARGYAEVIGWVPGNPNPPDLGVQLTAVNTDVFVYYPIWWCDPYWGYYGCWYWGWGVVDSYQAGTLITELLDVSSASPGQDLNTLWAALDYGVLYQYPSIDLPRALESIDRAFAQSAYIQTGP